jgi:hypothetical protein
LWATLGEAPAPGVTAELFGAALVDGECMFWFACTLGDAASPGVAGVPGEAVWA